MGLLLEHSFWCVGVPSYRWTLILIHLDSQNSAHPDASCILQLPGMQRRDYWGRSALHAENAPPAMAAEIVTDTRPPGLLTRLLKRLSAASESSSVPRSGLEISVPQQVNRKTSAAAAAAAAAGSPAPPQPSLDAAAHAGACIPGKGRPDVSCRRRAFYYLAQVGGPLSTGQWTTHSRRLWVSSHGASAS